MDIHNTVRSRRMRWSRSDGLSANEHALGIRRVFVVHFQEVKTSRANKAINQIDHDLP